MDKNQRKKVTYGILIGILIISIIVLAVTLTQKKYDTKSFCKELNQSLEENNCSALMLFNLTNFGCKNNDTLIEINFSNNFMKMMNQRLTNFQNNITNEKC